ncbi:hypothetical protein ASPCAL04055 [Aspergillus calidoustus]|uniref:Uncharacterized protein n=1 Tax=Aspergillus calidoustus TaxID=454130 RepID=A0A0U5C4K2_ASPCI|nr:hypothetical protein ASPCAL04055 [Aspergillus calidoustus]
MYYCAFAYTRNHSVIPAPPEGKTDFNAAATVTAIGPSPAMLVQGVVDHDYIESACDGATDATIEDNLLTHHHVTSLMYCHDYLGNYTGAAYVLGETNSVSYQGLAMCRTSMPRPCGLWTSRSMPPV